jgi:PTH1 family peptidyl-tRNA hydrolase
LLVAFGLGNPGDHYKGTRHNIGKEVINDLIQKLNLSSLPGGGSFTYAHDHGRDICLVVSTTYVNASGESACQVVESLGIDPAKLLVICDDYNLPLGALRIRKRGSDGGHNGLASVIYQLASEEIPRLRIGVGPLAPGANSVEFVLARFAPEDRATVEHVKRQAGLAVLEIAEAGLDAAMNKYNRKAVP